MAFGTILHMFKPPLVRPEDLAEFLGVPVSTLYMWRYQGKGPKAVKVGRHLRYHPAEIEAWVEAGGSGRAPNEMRHQPTRSIGLPKNKPERST